MRTMKVAFAAATLAVLPLFADIAMPEVVSHRGESNDRPENTLAAFRLAFERGVDGVECDVYCTSDGVPVIIHDSTTGRTAGSGTNLTVTASTWDQLKDVRVGAFGKWIGTEWEGETLPRFADYLALLSLNTTTKCIVELKGSNVNNLVANVVAAVQAQPLATKDRVAFIAFDASLISAVRAALPDYDALLLLSNVSDSSATLNSKIAACNGTGVDIHYQAAACSSESEIAAVKAAGYKFWVWTCDDVNTSFALASRGVQSVTTNKGGETKTAVASMIADANSRVEIVEPNFPAGLTAMEPSAYVQTGLLGNYDAIRNVGMNLPHDKTTATWKNLVAGGPDATRTVRSGKTPAGWTDTSYSFNEDAMFIVNSTFNLGVNFTVQIAITATPSAQGNSGDASAYNSWFNNHPKGNYGFWTNKTEDNLVGNFNFFVNSGTVRPTINPWGGRYVTWMLDGANNKCYTFKTDHIPAGTSLNVTKNPGALTYCWGAELSGSTYQAFVKGEYHSVRIYNKVLTDDEHVWNRIVDEVRYRGFVTNGCVVVASNRAGAEGTETSGTYYVNGHHAFTASDVTIDGLVYEPAGYKLESYNASNKSWNLVGEYDGASCTYTNCAANTGARITWNWRLKSGVKKIDADDYVQAGLVLGLDGIRNAGLAAAHDSAATTWKNLGTGGDLTLVTFDANNGAGAWKEKGYAFTAGSCFYADKSVFLGRQATIQFAAEHNMSIQVSKWPSIFGPGNENIDRYNIYTYTPRAGTGDDNRGDHLRFNAANVNGLSIGHQPWDGRFGNAIIDNNRSSVTNTAAYAWRPGTKSGDIGTYRYAVGAAHNSTANRQPRAYSGEIRAFRLYDRVLTEAELAYNMEIDNMRYYVGASRSTDTNLVEVAVESPGGVVTVDEKGSWIIRGDGASKTFSAPATVTVGNNTYTCTGYRIETWNASKRMWENPVETASATMVELSSANTNRRITWLYALTTGIRSAADYDVGDYVQKGLVANYDGIRNLGPENTHSLLGMFWHDSSYRDVPMVAASNTAFSAWNGLGHHFTASEVNFFTMTEPISLGQSSTIQSVLDAPASQQTQKFPAYIGFGNEDHSIFTRNKGVMLEQKLDTWLGPRTFCDHWTGKYFTHIVTSSHTYLFEGVEYANQTARTAYLDMPNNPFCIGAPNSYPNNYGARKDRAMSGDYYALRIYNRVLTEAEIAHNRTVDEIRYRGNFTNANVTVVCEVPFEGVEAPVSIPAGEYEVTGSFTFTASGLTVGEATFPVRYTVETWDGGEWGEPAEYEGGSYTYTAGAKVRLTWKWADPTIPVKATWTGLGDTGNLLDPANWSCVNAGGETITAAPTNVTTVVINGTTSFSIPEGVTTFPWKEIQFGGDVHTALRCGTWSYNSNAGYTGTLPGVFTLLSAADTSLANLDNGSYSTTPSAWQAAHLKRQRVRFDGWFYVTPAQAGTWTVNQKFDDYYCFGIDGSWVVANPTYQALLIGTREVSAGWHRFTIICGDTGGNGWGAYPGSAVQVEGVDAPISISWGDAPVRFAPSNFTFGTEAVPVITLSCDCDWSALGVLTLMNGATIDLNGHNLTAQPFASDYIGAMITNSNDEVLSTVTYTVPEGKTLTGGVAICGNVKVVKKGAGTYCSYAKDCTYSGGTFIDEGRAQPPDGSGTDTLYCYDQFKAFSTNEIVVASNAVFDLRANYAYRSRVVLAGGTFTNTKVDMTESGNGGSGIGRLTEDSTLNCTPYSIVFGDHRTDAATATTLGATHLGGHTLTVNIDGNGKHLYVRNNYIFDGKIDILSGGWLHIVNACVATNVDFKVGCALQIAAALSVRDYEAVWASNTESHNAGTAALNVYGTFTPAAGQKFYGCTMQDGSTIDLSGTTGAFSTLSYYTSGSTNIKFAANANVTVNLAGRTDLRTILKSENPFVVTWPESLGPAASVTFQVDAETSRNGLKIIRDDERNGLRLARKPSFMLIVR